jgi:hypothetical protein
MVLAIGPQSAHAAAPAAVTKEIDAFVASHPGSYRISDWKVEWDNGAVGLTWPDPVTGRIIPAEARKTSAPSAATSANATAAGKRGKRGKRKQIARASDVHGCPSGAFISDYYCFYNYRNFGGRMLQFKDCGGFQYLSRYDFQNKTASWVNTTNNRIYVYDNPALPVLLWDEQPDEMNGFVGDNKNNRADYFDSRC